MSMLTGPGAGVRWPGHAPKLLIVINTSWNVINFRLGLVRGLVANGYQVVVAAPRDRFSEAIDAIPGCRYVALPMRGHGRSPVEDLLLLRRMLAIFRAERPAAFLGFTVKPNVFGSFAARACGVPAINNIAGLGSVFNESSATARIVVLLYRAALRGSARVFFQNREDSALFTSRGIVRARQVGLLPGSGVDTARFTAAPPPATTGAPFTFLLVARLLREKGIAELAAAARIVRARHPTVRVRILGPLDPANPASVAKADLDGWIAEGLFDYLGTADDVRPILAQADCMVLPTYYREGTPRALLEAAAMGRAILTTDMPGCRDVVDDGENGYLVPPRDAAALAAAMSRLVELPADALAAMGAHSRAKIERQYDERIVVDRYLRALGEVLAPA